MKNNLFTTNINKDIKNHSILFILSLSNYFKMKLYDDIKTYMNKSENTVAIFAVCSKAFDAIDLNILMQKLHSFNFSKDSLYWTMNY